jgi:hypothetical protein
MTSSCRRYFTLVQPAKNSTQQYTNVFESWLVSLVALLRSENRVVLASCVQTPWCGRFQTAYVRVIRTVH